jgi:hypothetical protein
MTETRSTVLVNAVEWLMEERPGLPAGWVVANAPRPLQGTVTWTGPFRHGTFYAAAPEVVPGTFGWVADDAWLVELITNDRIRELAMAKLAEHGFASLEDADMTMEEMAAMMHLPWRPESV